MQKKLIALAIAGLASTSVLAAEDVQLYGIVDMYYGLGSATQSKSHSVINSGGLSTSRLGLKGAEDLGNGIKAIFNLEYALAADQNNSDTSGIGKARQQYVGLTGGFGTVVAGGLQTAGYDWGCAYTPLAGSAIDAQTNVNKTNPLLGCVNTNARVSNAAAYISPNFGGFTLALNHARLAEGGDTTTKTITNTGADGAAQTAAQANQVKDGTANLVSARYQNGPLDVGLVWGGYQTYRYNTDSKSSQEGSKGNEWGLGASYDFSVVKLFATYQQAKDKVGIGGKDKEYGIGIAVPVGAGTIVAQYASSKDETTPTAAQVGTGGSAGYLKNTAYTLAYAHGLSKRTTAYAGYTRLKGKVNGDVNGTDAGTGITNTPTILVAPNGEANANPSATPSSSAFAVGLRHKF